MFLLMNAIRSTLCKMLLSVNIIYLLGLEATLKGQSHEAETSCLSHVKTTCHNELKHSVM